jgi:carbon storage regulator
MLVLSRKAGQKITILDNIEISVLEIKGDTIRLGIKAPSVIPVYRSELLDAVREQNIKAAASAPADLRELAAAASVVKAAPGAIRGKVPGPARG